MSGVRSEQVMRIGVVLCAFAMLVSRGVVPGAVWVKLGVAVVGMCESVQMLEMGTGALGVKSGFGL